MSLRALIIGGFAACVAVTLALALLTLNSLYQQVGPVQDIGHRADRVANLTVPLILTMKDVRTEMVQLQQFLTNASVAGDASQASSALADAKDWHDKVLNDIDTAKTVAESMGRSADVAVLTQVEKAVPGLLQTGKDMVRAFSRGDDEDGSAHLSAIGDQTQSLMEKLDSLTSSVTDNTWDEMSELLGHSHRLREANDSLRTMLVSVSILATILSFVIAGIIGLRSTKAFKSLLVDVNNALNENFRATPMLEESRKDEFGPIARALSMFRRHALDVRQMQQEQERLAQEGEVHRHQALLNMADTVERETASVVERVAGEGKSIAASAAAMAESAVSVGNHSNNVADAARHALHNAEAVAGAAEELSASIREIASQVDHSADMVEQVVTKATRTGETVESLTHAMSQIGDVARLIADIAQRTHRLALNATIEAQRAGVAGKGFAVVADEVKHLAEQTSQSTDEITQQLNQLRQVGGTVAREIDDMLGSIHGVAQISSSIATAVQQQDSATQEIVRNVVETSDAAREVSDHIATVAQEAGVTGQRASEVQGLLESMAQNILELRRALNAAVRTATPEVNRRRDERVELEDHGATVEAGGGRLTARLVDISLSGGQLELPSEACTMDSGRLFIEGLNTPVTYRLIEVSNGRARVRFDEHSEQAQALRKFMERAAAGKNT